MPPSVLPLTEHHSISQHPQKEQSHPCLLTAGDADGDLSLSGSSRVSRQHKDALNCVRSYWLSLRSFQQRWQRKDKKESVKTRQAGSSSAGKVLCPFLTPTLNASFAQETSLTIQIMSRQAYPLQRGKTPLPPNFPWEASSWCLNSRDLINLEREELQTALFSQQQVNGTCRRQRQILPYYFRMLISKPRIKIWHEAYYKQLQLSLVEISQGQRVPLSHLGGICSSRGHDHLSIPWRLSFASAAGPQIPWGKP